MCPNELRDEGPICATNGDWRFRDANSVHESAETLIDVDSTDERNAMNGLNEPDFYLYAAMLVG